ncbi:MAG: hypothetical protein WDM77_13035 [Steroidobacteraceae bacterium]
MPQPHQLARQRRVPFQGHGHGEHGEGHTEFLRQAQHPPHACAAAVLVNGFHLQIARVASTGEPTTSCR